MIDFINNYKVKILIKKFLKKIVLIHFTLELSDICIDGIK